MLKAKVFLAFGSLVCLCCFVCASVREDKPWIQVVNWVSIRPYYTPLFSQLGKINNYRSCGGQGQILDWRNEACVNSLPEPFICPFQANGDFRGELVFVPKQSSDALGVIFSIEAAGKVKTVTGLLANSTVQAGQPYAMQGAGGPNEELKDNVITSRFTLYRPSDNVVEVCGESDFVVY